MKPNRETVIRAAQAMLIEHDPIHCAPGMSYLNFVPLAYVALEAAMEPIAGIYCGVSLPPAHPKKSEYSGVYGLIRLEDEHE